MRKIAKETDYGQPIIIFLIAIGYFCYAQIVRQRTLHPLIFASSALISIVMFGITFVLVTKFFYFLYRRRTFQGAHEVTYKPFVFTFAYSLLPTLIWFYATSTLYYVLPPPRTTSFLGKGFSLTFVTFSVTLLLWRIILAYLSVRFSAKASFYKVVASLVLFAMWILPYSYFMYQLRIFRIPFI